MKAVQNMPLVLCICGRFSRKETAGIGKPRRVQQMSRSWFSDDELAVICLYKPVYVIQSIRLAHTLRLPKWTTLKI